jgi:hypothetical protein
LAVFNRRPLEQLLGFCGTFFDSWSGPSDVLDSLFLS